MTKRDTTTNSLFNFIYFNSTADIFCINMFPNTIFVWKTIEEPDSNKVRTWLWYEALRYRCDVFLVHFNFWRDSVRMLQWEIGRYPYYTYFIEVFFCSDWSAIPIKNDLTVICRSSNNERETGFYLNNMWLNFKPFLIRKLLTPLRKPNYLLKELLCMRTC